jgi:hypothetical protein
MAMQDIVCRECQGAVFHMDELINKTACRHSSEVRRGGGDPARVAKRVRRSRQHSNIHSGLATAVVFRLK